MTRLQRQRRAGCIAVAYIAGLVTVGTSARALDCEAELRWVNRSNPGADRAEYLGFIVQLAGGSLSAPGDEDDNVETGPTQTLLDCGVGELELYLGEACEPWSRLYLGAVPLPEALRAKGSGVLLICSDDARLPGCTSLGKHAGRLVSNGWLPNQELRLVLRREQETEAYALPDESASDDSEVSSVRHRVSEVAQICDVTVQVHGFEADTAEDRHLTLCEPGSRSGPAFLNANQVTADPCQPPSRDAGTPPSPFGFVKELDASSGWHFSWGPPVWLEDAGQPRVEQTAPPPDLSPSLCSVSGVGLGRRSRSDTASAPLVLLFFVTTWLKRRRRYRRYLRRGWRVHARCETSLFRLPLR